MLLFADDVALLASSREQMNQQIEILTRFCDTTGMSVNLTKTRWMRIGKKAQETFFFRGVEIEECRIYKYLGVEFAANLSWTKCVKSRGASSYRALLAMGNRCDKEKLVSWTLRSHLFNTLVIPVALYGTQVWSPYVSKSGWSQPDLETNFQSEMSVNLSKTKWLRRGPGLAEQVMFQGQPIAECQKYKYLGLEFTSNLAWSDCVKAITASALRALYAFKITWPLKVKLFVTLVQPVVLFGCPIWGPTISRSSWSKVEVVHKRFLQEELGVRSQIPYTLLLAETGRIPLEAEALLLAIQFYFRVSAQEHCRYSHQALRVTYARGWTADLHRWAAQWEFSEENWRPVEGLRDRLTQAVIRKLWAEPSPRQAYYLRDISRLSPYKEQAYLVADIPRRILVLLARYRTSSHDLRVEIREEYDILFHDLRDLFEITPTRLGAYVMAVDRSPITLFWVQWLIIHLHLHLQLEVTQKRFLMEELGVWSQIPYVILLAETGRLPIEIEALLLAIQFVQRLRQQDASRCSYQAWVVSRRSGWYAQLCSWASSWNFPVEVWDGTSLRERLTEAVVSKLWHDPSARMQYYKRDVSQMLEYSEGRFAEIREAHQIQLMDLRDFFDLPPGQLGSYILAIDRARSAALKAHS
ncbi:hypothetical protein R1sor_027180 [Riccia sorocarpa]|uniref:Reverse transcriptase domain-containing protein n=1 Tax=Riccia sorocarpa TaxID=122646 RepID=A0ABD3GF75_9MARC